MKKVCVIANAGKETAAERAEQVREFFLDRGIECVVLLDDFSEKTSYAPVLQDDMECAVVLGGDGTLIYVARKLAEKKIPVFGINMGNLGFLTHADSGKARNALEALISGKYCIEERMMLEASVDGKDFGTALNDVVITRNGFSRIISVGIFVNGTAVCNYRGDGVIVATPTGSTGYNMSAGGPIVSPAARLMILTPICPHTFNSRSIVLPECDTIEVEVCADRNGFDDERQLSFDGGNVFNLRAGDRIEIKAATESTRIIRIKKISFIEQLRNKMGNK